MRIEPYTSVLIDEKAASNIVSAVLLMLIFVGVLSSAVSFAVPILGNAAAAIEMQRAKDVLSLIDAAVRTNPQTTLEYRLYNGYINAEKQRIDLLLINSSTGLTNESIVLKSSTLYYKAQEYPSPSISYAPEISLQMQNGNKTLNLALSEICYDALPQPGYHRIRFSSEVSNSSFTGEFTVHIRDHQYNRSRYFFNISRIDLEIRKISMWDEEWRG
ncbi:MAG: hypothetical protein KKI06_00905 [Euryarchaeota archaeon]|nr:hypothetical protein [Euryarchaeota archaeon]